MDITPLVPKGKLVISRYGHGGLVLGEAIHKGSILMAADGIWPWAVMDAHGITEASLAPLLALKIPPEVLLIGTGAQFMPLPEALRMGLRAKGIMAEGMDTGAACRTYNVLMAEDRRVAAALIAI